MRWVVRAGEKLAFGGKKEKSPCTTTVCVFSVFVKSNPQTPRVCVSRITIWHWLNGSWLDPWGPQFKVPQITSRDLRTLGDLLQPRVASDASGELLLTSSLIRQTWSFSAVELSLHVWAKKNKKQKNPFAFDHLPGGVCLKVFLLWGLIDLFSVTVNSTNPCCSGGRKVTNCPGSKDCLIKQQNKLLALNYTSY